MSDKILITHWNKFLVTARLSNDKVVDLDFDNTCKSTFVGNIYIGKVKEVVKNINAAFIEYQSNEKGYYSIADNPNPVFLNKKNNDKICQGDELIVQIAKDGIKTKDPVLSSRLEFAGKYAVLTAGNNRIGFSNKFTNLEKKEKLIQMLKKYRNSAYGFIIRTNAKDADLKEVLAEIDQLVVKYNDVMKTAFFRTCHSKLYENEKSYVQFIRDLSEGIEYEIVTDDEDVYYNISTVFPEKNAVLYKDDMISLIKFYRLEKCIEEINKERVWLKSGAYLIIQPTEALTVIDVNTGKCIKGKQTDEVFYNVNLEAAKEIARQIKLRNISGIIIVDFININNKELNDMLLSELEKYTRRDSVKTVVEDITRLGLVEITRKKIKPPVYEQIQKAE